MAFVWPGGFAGQMAMAVWAVSPATKRSGRRRDVEDLRAAVAAAVA
jgi:hypothetical protein